MEKNKKTKNVHIQAKKGFTLLETLVAISIFSLVSVMLAGSFSAFLKNSISAKKLQRGAESAQYSMNLMTKTIRTSTLVSVSSNSITMFDNSQSACVIYKYQNNILQMATANGAGITGVANCNTTNAPTLANFSELTKPGEISAMNIIESTSMIKRITILLGLRDGGVVQSSVSLRGK